MRPEIGRFVLLTTLATAAALPLAACSGEDAPASCSPEQTTALVRAADLSQLLAVAANPESKSALLDEVASRCCKVCGGASASRPLLADTEACIACAGAYAGGNPADHIEGCAAQLCAP